MLRKIKLYGELAKKFGSEFNFEVSSVAEAVRLLQANFKDFKKYVLDNSEPGYHIYVGEQDIDEDELHYPVSSNEVIKIVPVVAGSGGVAKIVVGAILIVATHGAAASWLAQAGASSAVVSTVAAIGTSLVIGGVTQLLTKNPTMTQQPNGTTNKPSYTFNGPVNTTRQGNPVSVGYGRLLIGSQVISAGLFAEAL